MGCDADIAWCAGFLDGEGSFGFARITGTARRKGYVSADQIDRAPLDKLARVIGGSVSGPVRETSAGNPIYRWILRGNPCAALEALIPHLTLKRDRAELVLAHARTFGRKGRYIPPEILAERERIEARYDALKGGQ